MLERFLGKIDNAGQAASSHPVDCSTTVGTMARNCSYAVTAERALKHARPFGC